MHSVVLVHQSTHNTSRMITLIPVDLYLLPGELRSPMRTLGYYHTT